MKKQFIKYAVEDGFVYVEAESDLSEENDDISLDDDGVIEGGRFDQAIRGLKPLANSIFKVLKEMDEPSEIQLELGVKLGTKAGLIIASADTEASIKVTLKWQKKSDE